MGAEILTIAGFAKVELVIKKSRFIGLAWPVATEEEAQGLIEKSREDYPGATHYVYAYVLGKDGEIVRATDDGEPGGTAGKPVLSIINFQELTNVLVVVVRYYGGIMLGAPGLVRAYSQGAKEAIAKAGIKKLEPTVKCSLTLAYNQLDQVRYQLEQLGAQLGEIEYGAQVKFAFTLVEEKFVSAETLFQELMIPFEVEGVCYL